MAWATSWVTASARALTTLLQNWRAVSSCSFNSTKLRVWFQLRFCGAASIPIAKRPYWLQLYQHAWLARAERTLSRLRFPEVLTPPLLGTAIRLRYRCPPDGSRWSPAHTSEQICGSSSRGKPCRTTTRRVG